MVAGEGRVAVPRRVRRRRPGRTVHRGVAVPRPDERPVLSIGLCWSGDLHDGERILEPLRRCGRPVVDAIDVLLDIVPDMPSTTSGIGLQGLRGAAARVPVDATAFPHRTPQYDFLILGQWDDLSASENNISWARRAFDAMKPHLADAVYVNNLGSEGPDRVRAAYGSNHTRLAELKGAYDPDNVFRLNQNVKPSR